MRRIESDPDRASYRLGHVPGAKVDTRLTYAVLAERDTNGVVTVEFLTGGGFPVRHTGYLYRSSGVVEPGSFAASRWRIRRASRPRWFEIWD